VFRDPDFTSGDINLSFVIGHLTFPAMIILMKKRTSVSSRRYWSGRVTKESNALDLEGGVFTLSTPRKIALSLKRSAESSLRRKADPFRSAMSMLNFYINRAGKNLPLRRKKVLNKAKEELRNLFKRK